MEIQFLSDKSTEQLKKAIALFKKYRTVFSEGDVAPIGEKPSGRSFTGFYIKNGREEYALVFREVTDKASHVFMLPSEKTSAVALASNADVTAQMSDGMLKVEFSKQRAYAFIKLSW